jgi:hypothetical protein
MRPEGPSESDAQKWEINYLELVDFQKKHGHCIVPSTLKSRLAYWVINLRADRRNGKDDGRVTADRIDRLDRLGFDWAPGKQRRGNWDNMYKQLKEFHHEHGHCEVPRRLTANRNLGEWCRKQQRDQAALSQDRRARLDEIGFDFESLTEKNERRWNEMLQRLKAYKREHGDCLVPSRSSAKATYPDKELSLWVTNQRTGYKHDTIPNHRIVKLEEVGFVWSLREGSPIVSERHEILWEKMFEQLRDFYKDHDHFSISKQADGRQTSLSRWIGTQRRFYAEGQMRKDRKLRLEEVGFVWGKGAAHRNQMLWEAAFVRLKDFRKNKGHAFVLRSDDMALWRWVEKMNGEHSRGTLSHSREEQLRSIGFWDPPPLGFEARGISGEASFETDEESLDEGENVSTFDEDDEEEHTLSSLPYAIGTRVRKVSYILLVAFVVVK